MILDTKTGGKNETITVADDAKIYYVDEDGKISESSYRSISKDENDKVYALVDEYLVTDLVIEEVPAGEKPVTPSGDTEILGLDITGPTAATLKLYVADGSTADTLDDNQIGKYLEEQGWKNVKYNGSTWSFEKGYSSYSGVTITQTQYFKVKAVLADANTSTGWSFSSKETYLPKTTGGTLTMTVQHNSNTTFSLSGVSASASTGMTPSVSNSLSVVDGAATVSVTVSSLTKDGPVTVTLG